MHTHAYVLVDIHQVCKSVLTADADYEAAYMMCKAVAILTTMAPGVSARTHTRARAHTHTHGILLLAIQTRARSLFLTIPNARDHIWSARTCAQECLVRAQSWATCERVWSTCAVSLIITINANTYTQKRSMCAYSLAACKRAWSSCATSPCRSGTNSRLIWTRTRAFGTSLTACHPLRPQVLCFSVIPCIHMQQSRFLNVLLVLHFRVLDSHGPGHRTHTQTHLQVQRICL